MDVKTFKEWCEDNGKRWIGAASFEEFEANAKEYEAYCAEQESNAKP